MTVGDHEFDGVNDPRRVSMDPQTELGKAIEIDLDTRAVSIFATGLRNPQGLLISSDGVIWETEHGPHGGDELNVLQPGLNYGWPEVSYGVNYGFPRRPWPANPVQGSHDGFTKPMFAFMPSIGISNLVEANGSEFPLWKGDLLVTSLKDSAIQRLRREADRIVYSERIPLGERLRDIQVLPNGQLVILTDAANLIIVRQRTNAAGVAGAAQPAITVSGYGALGKVFAEESLSAAMLDTDADSGRKVFNARCAGCHALAAGPGIGPPLERSRWPEDRLGSRIRLLASAGWRRWRLDPTAAARLPVESERQLCGNDDAGSDPALPGLRADHRLSGRGRLARVSSDHSVPRCRQSVRRTPATMLRSRESPPASSFSSAVS